MQYVSIGLLQNACMHNCTYVCVHCAYAVCMYMLIVFTSVSQRTHMCACVCVGLSIYESTVYNVYGKIGPIDCSIGSSRVELNGLSLQPFLTLVDSRAVVNLSYFHLPSKFSY